MSGSPAWRIARIPPKWPGCRVCVAGIGESSEQVRVPCEAVGQFDGAALLVLRVQVVGPAAERVFEVAADIEQTVWNQDGATALLLPESVEFEQGAHAVSLGRPVRDQSVAVRGDDVGRRIQGFFR